MSAPASDCRTACGGIRKAMPPRQQRRQARAQVPTTAAALRTAGSDGRPDIPRPHNCGTPQRRYKTQRKPRQKEPPGKAVSSEYACPISYGGFLHFVDFCPFFRIRRRVTRSARHTHCAHCSTFFRVCQYAGGPQTDFCKKAPAPAKSEPGLSTALL